MADFEAMYYALFNRVSDVIEDLQKIQQDTEELFILTSPPSEIPGVPTITYEEPYEES